MEHRNAHNMSHTSIPMEQKSHEKVKRSDENEVDESPEATNRETSLSSSKSFDEAKFLETYNSLWKEVDAQTINDIDLNRLVKATETIKAVVTDNNFKKYDRVILTICAAKDLEAFKNLLSKADLKVDFIKEVVEILIAGLEPDLFGDWFDFLHDHFNRFNISRRYTNSWNENTTLLEVALWYEHNTAVKKLCKAGAFIGSQRECYKEETGYLIDKMDQKVLEGIFDSCITTNGNPSKDQEYTINFDYRIFVEPYDRGNEMTPIMRILNSDELLPLLKHPLITSLLTLKWLRIAGIFYLNFILYCFYGLSMVAYIIFKCEKFDSNSVFVRLPWYLTFLGIAYLTIRETIQLIRHPIRYFRTLSNYIEIILIVLSITIITMVNFESPDEKILTVVTVLLMATELCWIVGYLPILSISTHMLMLEEVLKTFLKSYSLYSIFVLTFSLCFYVLFGTVHREHREKKAEIAKNATNPNNICTEVADAGADYKFENVFKSIPKTMAMVVGELDFESLNFQDAFGYILFFLFVICMTVVLMNLLNGLAVSDIQTIKDQAELNELICRAKLLASHGRNILSIDGDCFRKCNLSVQPNFKGAPNKVKFPGTCPCTNCKEKAQVKEQQITLDLLEDTKPTNKWYNWLLNEKNVRHVMDALRGKCTAMGASIVKSADKNILHKENSELENIEEKVKSIEAKLANLISIEENVKTILKNITIKES